MGGRPLEEAELVERARKGDVGAYEELVRMYQRLAGRVAYVVSGSAADAEDAVQEAFVKAYQALGRFRTGAAFRPWLMRIVANEAGPLAGMPSSSPGRPRAVPWKMRSHLRKGRPSHVNRSESSLPP